MYGQHATDIVGYTFNADTYCPDHIIGALPTGEGEPYEGWALAKGADPMTPEAELDEIAWANGYNRDDESTYDSGEFPKVIFASQAWDSDDYCATCGRPLVED